MMGMVFYGFHTMFTMAILMFFIVVVSLWLRWQKRLFSTQVVPARSRDHDACGIHRDDRWLVHRRDRPSALGDLGHLAYGRRRFACAGWSAAIDA